VPRIQTGNANALQHNFGVNKWQGLEINDFEAPFRDSKRFVTTDQLSNLADLETK
jgi:hypothetical protein